MHPVQDDLTSKTSILKLSQRLSEIINPESRYEKQSRRNKWHIAWTTHFSVIMPHKKPERKATHASALPLIQTSSLREPLLSNQSHISTLRLLSRHGEIAKKDHISDILSRAAQSVLTTHTAPLLVLKSLNWKLITQRRRPWQFSAPHEHQTSFCGFSWGLHPYP